MVGLRAMQPKSADPPEPRTRSRMTTFYLTEDDYRLLKRYAASGGFKSASHMITAIMEPLLQGQLSILSFTRSAKRLQMFMESHGQQFRADTSSLKELFLFPPPPPPIPDEPISVAQLRQDFERVLEILEHEQRPNPKPKTTHHDHTPRNPTPGRRDRVRG
jgi:hypothetical protein